jgi:hypothetical protein
MDLTEALYRALKSYPCRCAYKRTKDQKWIWELPPGGGELSRVLEQQCTRCVAIERYELEVNNDQ